MAKQKFSRGILLVFGVFLVSAVAACNAQSEPPPTYTLTSKVIPTPTVTPVPRPTPTPSLLSTNTLVPTPTATSSPTPTPTPTAMPTPTATPTPTPGLTPTQAPTATPTDEGSPLVSEGFIAISNGFGHTCALRSDGSPLCWGVIRYAVPPRDAYGRGSYIGSEPPDEKFMDISVGPFHVCALRTALLSVGAIFAWRELLRGGAACRRAIHHLRRLSFLLGPG